MNKNKLSTGIVLLALFALLVANLVIWSPVVRAQSDTVFAQLNLLVDLRQMLVQNYVETPDQRKMVVAAAHAMVDSLEDPYTVYMTPDEFKSFDRQVHGSFSGIGAEVDLQDARLRIVTPLEGSPAWRSGVQAGDVVLEIDGKTTEGLSIQDAVTRLTGTEGTQVTIKVRHVTGDEATITITRARIKVQTVKGIGHDSEQHWRYMLDEQHKVGYVRLTQFNERTADELTAALESLKAQGVKGLILDLRFNPGGLLEAAQQVSDMFLDGGKTIVSVKGRVVREEIYRSQPGGLFLDGPMAVLVNEGSASAAEIVSGALLDNGRAQLVGTRTFGKGSVQQVRSLNPDAGMMVADDSEGAIKITNAYYYLPNGRNIHRRPNKETWGVDPNDGFYVPMKPEQIRKMIEMRVASDVLRQQQGPSTQPSSLTPEYIEASMADAQLAAGLRAVTGKLETGQWPVVGMSGSQALAMAGKRDLLERQRTLMLARIDDINKELDRLAEGKAPTPNAGVAASQPGTPAPSDMPAEIPHAPRP